MNLTKEQHDSLLEAAIPLIKWLNENCHPHFTAIVTQVKVELLEGIAMSITYDFVKD